MMEVNKIIGMLSIGLLATAGARHAGAQVAGENLIKNPGFESNQDWWGFDFSFGAGTGTITFDDPLAVHEGAKGAKVSVTTAGAENWHVQLQCPPQFTAIKDAPYTLSFWARTNSAESKSIHVAVQDGAPNFTYRAGQDYRLDTAWQKIEQLWTSDVEGLEALRFNIYVGSDTGTYYFDEFTLVAGNVPTRLRHARRSGGMPAGRAIAQSAIDAAGRSLRMEGTRNRAGIVFSR